MSSGDPQQPYGYDPQQPYQYDPYSGQPYPYQPQPERGGYPQPIPYGAYQPAPPYGVAPPDNPLRGWAIGALVTNIAMVFMCCSVLSVAGIVVSALALARADYQPESSRTLLKWAWGLVIAWVVLLIALFAVIAVAATVSGPQ